MKPVFTTLRPIVLASGSPRRRQFLSDLGIEFRALPAILPEPLPQKGEKPRDYVLRSAKAKVAETAQQKSDAVIIGADTIVVLGDEIMGKPKDNGEALAMLKRLSGATHTVFTALVVAFPEGREESTVAASFVTMSLREEAVLKAYVNTGEPADKAGAYAVQGQGSFLIKDIQGSWTNIVGLPVTELLDILLKNNCIAPCPDTPDKA